MKSETAQKAAKWWADHLRQGAMLDHGDYSKTGMMTLGLAVLLQEQERKQQKPEQIDAFERELTRLILEQPPRDIDVDYHPCKLLQDAADAVGLQLGMTTLPWKTWMRIQNDSIIVAEGYGQPSREL